MPAHAFMLSRDQDREMGQMLSMNGGHNLNPSRRNNVIRRYLFENFRHQIPEYESIEEVHTSVNPNWGGIELRIRTTDMRTAGPHVGPIPSYYDRDYRTIRMGLPPPPLRELPPPTPTADVFTLDLTGVAADGPLTATEVAERQVPPPVSPRHGGDYTVTGRASRDDLAAFQRLAIDNSAIVPRFWADRIHSRALWSDPLASDWAVLDDILATKKAPEEFRGYKELHVMSVLSLPGYIHTEGLAKTDFLNGELLPRMHNSYRLRIKQENIAQEKQFQLTMDEVNNPMTILERYNAAMAVRTLIDAQKAKKKVVKKEGVKKEKKPKKNAEVRVHAEPEFGPLLRGQLPIMRFDGAAIGRAIVHNPGA